MKRILFLLVCLLSLFCRAQGVLTLDECLGMARQNNKRVSISLLQQESAHYQKKYALSNFLPQFSIEGMGLYSTVDGSFGVDGGTLPVVGADGMPTGVGAYFPGMDFGYEVGWMYGVGIRVQQPIFAGGKISAGYRLAKIEESVVGQNGRLTESEIILATTRAYADLVRADAILKVAVSYNGLLKELMRSVEKTVVRGVKTRNDLLKVEVRLSESELDLHRAENGRRLAAMNLCHHMGVSLHTSIEVSTELPMAEDIATDTSVDIGNRPEVLMLTDKSKAMRLKVKMARAEMLPRLGFVGEYGYMHGFRFAGKNLFGKWNLSVGLRLSIPIVGLGTYSRYRQAQVQFLQTQAEKEEKVGQMFLEATQARNRLDEASLELELARKRTDSATENLRVSGSQYHVGSETLSGYLEAQTLWLKAEQELIDARINRFLCWMEYRKTVGTLN